MSFVNNNSLLNHFKNIILLPFSVTVVIPHFLLRNEEMFSFPDPIYLKIVAAILFITGVLLFISTVYLFYKIGKGTLAPWNPTQKLVIAGAYRYVRNPMISGVFFILLSETVYFTSANIFLWSILFFFINTIYFILVEEPGLEERFGAEYVKYKLRVQRWIPKIFSRKKISE